METFRHYVRALNSLGVQTYDSYGRSSLRSNQPLAGSYVEVTFLDPHPANSSQNTYASGGTCSARPPPDPDSGMSVGILTLLTPVPFITAVLGFDLTLGDPDPALPAGVVQAVDLWFQRTPAMVNSWARVFPNLWGQDHVSPGGARLTGVNDLTCQHMPSAGTSPGPFILHREVHDFYLETVVMQTAGGVDP
jgi:hypothetical protein